MKESTKNLIIAFSLVSLVLLVLGVLGTIGFGFALDTSDNLNVYRYCLFMTNTGIYDDPGGGDPTGVGSGWIEVNLNNKHVKYEILFDGVGTLLNLAINGPLNSTSAFVADQFFPTNGSIASLTPDSDGFNRGSASISNSDANQIVDNPAIFYLILKTSDYTLGSIGTRLGMECRDNN
jgi:hypothetical protein